MASADTGQSGDDVYERMSEASAAASAAAAPSGFVALGGAAHAARQITAKAPFTRTSQARLHVQRTREKLPNRDTGPRPLRCDHFVQAPDRRNAAVTARLLGVFVARRTAGP